MCFYRKVPLFESRGTEHRRENALFYKNLYCERIYAEGVEMMAEIHALQVEYEGNNIVVIGDLSTEVHGPISNPETGEIAPAGKIYMLRDLIETSLFVNTEYTIPFLKKNFKMELGSALNARRMKLSVPVEVQSMGRQAFRQFDCCD